MGRSVIMASITIGSTSGSRPYCTLSVTQSSQNIANNSSTAGIKPY